jgi:hypothetical protein
VLGAVNKYRRGNLLAARLDMRKVVTLAVGQL